MNLQKLIDRIDNANLEDPEEFHELFNAGKFLMRFSDRELANLLDVSIPSVIRWRREETTPAKVMKRLAYRVLKEQAKRRLDEI